MNDFVTFIKSLLEQGGPLPSQYEELNNWFKIIGNQVKSG